MRAQREVIMAGFSVSRLIGAAALAAPLLFLAPQAAAQQSRPHAEECTTLSWGFLRAADHEYGTINLCAYPIEVWFVSGDGVSVQSQVPPRGVFRTGVTLSDQISWIAATCRAGYTPSVEVALPNWDAIADSNYTCVRP
jgi:hypothetical protein